MLLMVNAEEEGLVEELNDREHDAAKDFFYFFSHIDVCLDFSWSFCGFFY